MLMQSTAVFAQTPTVSLEKNALNQREDCIETLLNKLGIVTDSGLAEDTIIKGKFLEYVVNMLQIGLIPATEQRFYDVPLTSSYADIVNTAYSVGLTKGNADGTLAVDTPITMNEAAVIAVRALGASILLPKNDNSYSAYLGVATRLGIFEDVRISGGVLNREAVLQLLYNTLNAKCIATYDGKEFFLEDVTILSEYYDVYKGEGILQACEYGEIYGGGSLEDRCVTIDGKSYKYDHITAKKLLGHRVKFYYDASDRTVDAPEIICIYSHQNEVLTLNTEDVELHRQGVLKYREDNSHLRDVRLEADALTLLNGKRIAVGSGGMVIPVYGTVSLVDNDNNGAYDVILYSEYTLAIATGYSEQDQKLYYRKGVVELENYDKYYIFDKDGKQLDITDITKDAILNISENGDKTVAEIVVCKDTVEFEISAMMSEQVKSYTVYHLEDENKNELRTAPKFTDICTENAVIAGNTAMHNRYVAALNTDGTIAAILKKSDKSGFSYGYVITYAPGASSFKPPQVKMLTENDGVQIYNVADKVNLTEGNVTGKVTDDVLMTKISAGVVRYQLNNENEIKSMELSQAAGSSDSVLRKDVDIKAENKGYTEDTRFYSANNMIGGRIIISPDTCVFMLPEDASLSSDEHWYSATSGIGLENQAYYPSAISYKDDEDVYADVLVLSQKEKLVKTSMVMLVEKVVMKLDSDNGEYYEALKGYVNGNKMVYCIENASGYPRVDHQSASGFVAAKGDVVRFAVNDKGRISMLEPVFDCDMKAVYNYDMSSTEKYVFNNSVCQVYGQMNDIYDGIYMNVIDENDANQKNYYYPITAGTRIYEYDASNSSNPVKAISTGDIPTIKSNRVTNEKVLIVTRDTTTTLVVVYK